jgi:hypothetical protein
VRIMIAAIVLVLMWAASIAGSYVLSLRALHDSQQALCPVLELITRRPVPRPANPSANPSRVNSYELYTDSRSAEHHYRCSANS